MSAANRLHVIPTADPVWLRAAVAEALAGGPPVLPVPPEQTEAPAVRELREQAERGELPAETALLIRTSGSTGVPKTVALSAAALRASAEATHAALGGPGQWLVTLPLHLISGAQMLVRGILADTTPVLGVGGGSWSVDTLLDRVAAMSAPRRYVSLVPVQLARLVQRAKTDAEVARAAAKLDAVLVGGGGLSVRLRQDCFDLGIALRRSYGATETAGGCVYDGVEIGDTRVRIRDGEVQLGGSTLALGYVGDAELTARQFITDPATGERWYRTGDAGSLLGGMLEVTGRLDRVVISGGVNVSLDAVERSVHNHPGWHDAAVAAVAHPEWGERPVVVVGQDAVAGEAPRTEFASVRAAVKAELGPAAQPDRVITVPEIPRLPGGKPDRAAIQKILETR